MPFNTLMLTCLSTKRHFTENGKNIHISPVNDEVILLFVIDEQSNDISTFRRDLRISNNEKICDVVFYYFTPEKKLFCFAELKGGDIELAADQIINIKNRFIDQLHTATRNRSCIRMCKDIECKGYILKHGSAPKYYDKKEVERKLNVAFRRRENWEISEKSDIGHFIRK